LKDAVAEVVSDARVGARVLVALRPEDVVVGPVPATPPPSTSARNRMRGRITRVTPVGSQVRLRLDCGFPLVALITRRSYEELALKEGSLVALSFKATAAHLLVR
ncbi:MAG TPA: TOBE domain-containing protein, partial [Chloroflexota bacterium]|nr:TOBE domain-containing protein [Chloroflexota bacterium]